MKEQNLTLAEKSELEREFKYKRMKTMHEINMRLMNERDALKESLAELIPIVDHVVNGLILNEHYTEHLAMKLISYRAKKLLSQKESANRSSDT